MQLLPIFLTDAYLRTYLLGTTKREINQESALTDRTVWQTLPSLLL